MGFLGKLAKGGTSLAVRLPAAYARAIGVGESAKVELSIEEGRLVLKPIQQVPHYNLDALVAQITDENRHQEVETGSPVGAEFGSGSAPVKGEAGVFEGSPLYRRNRRCNRAIRRDLVRIVLPPAPSSTSPS